MPKLVVIGIDGMDGEFVRDHLDVLPNFGRLKQRGHGGMLRSVFPTDSIPAWITIFTGIPPVEHGFLDAIDYFKKDHKNYEVDISVFRDKTFWDVLSAAGHRCCVVNPFMAYPAWDINGIMVSGPVFVEGSKEMITPASLGESYELPSLGGIVDFPTKKTLGAFCQESRQYTLDQHTFALELMEKEGPFDLFFSTYLTLDRIQHFLWRYHDPGDPTYPGPSEFQSVVLDAYKMFDTIVGDYLDRCDDETELVVISDHGHGRRCTEVVNVNEILRRAGFLEVKAGKKNPLDPRRLLQMSKKLTMEFLDRHDLTDLTYTIAKLIPKTRALKKASFLVDEDSNLAYAPYFAGTNPCGGVAINRERASAAGREYNELRREIVELLRQRKHPESGRPLFAWVENREDFLGNGAALGKYPDVLYLMNSGYGTSWDLFGPTVAINTTHRKISGGHKVDGVLYSTFCSSLMMRSDGKPMGLESVSSLILEAFGLPKPGTVALPDRSERPTR
jgi:predicted AlkP superfamily phosphohydrolase/phosphomutase